MAGSLPVPTKTWLTATVTNSLLGDDYSNMQDLVLKMKNQRKTFGHVVSGSGNHVSGGMDAVDRLNSTADFALSTYIWIVLKQPGSGAQDLLYYLNGGAEADWGFAHSPSGSFSGGGYNTLPTAPDQSSPYFNSFFGRGDGGTNVQMVGHLWVSDDLTCCRQMFFFNNVHFGSIFLDQALEPASGWDHPNYIIVDKFGFSKSFDQGAAKVDTYMNDYDGGGTGIFWAHGPSGAMRMTGVTLATGVSQTAGRLSPLMDVQVAKNGITNTYRKLPGMSLYRAHGYSDEGINGEVPDVWWVPDLFALGATTPLDGSEKFVLIRNQMHKWNGTAFQTA